MAAEWITPKTDWEDGDYYQHEDAERFLNNINYLRALGSPMVPDLSSMLVPREYVNNIDYFSVFNISFEQTITFNDNGYSAMSYQFLLPDTMDIDNVHYMFKIGLEMLFKFRLLREYYVDNWSSYHGYNKYPMYLNDNKGDDNPEVYIDLYPQSTYRRLYKGWFLFPRYVRKPDPDETLLDPLWLQVMHYSIPKPFSTYSTTLKYINIESRELLANQPFFTADVLNRIETYMLEVYNTFTTLRRTFPREDS